MYFHDPNSCFKQEPFLSTLQRPVKKDIRMINKYSILSILDNLHNKIELNIYYFFFLT